MNNEEANFMKQQEVALKVSEQNLQNNQMQQSQQAMMMQNQEQNMIKDQLDLTVELDTIENLLRGKILKKNEVGESYWEDPTDPEMVILSDHGIHLIMNTIAFYINKNTLLSNYDEDTINRKMEDFASDLSDTIFMEYEKVFQYPTFEDCKKILTDRIEKKTELRKFALELVGRESDESAIKKSLLDEIEGKIESEITKIKEQIIKNKLKRFMILLRTVQDAVHSTYLRAWKGQERTTLRQHIHISESRGGNQFSQNRGGAGVMGWLKPK